MVKKTKKRNNRNITNKINLYRTKIQELKGKSYKTKKALTHKRQKLYYLHNRLKTLTSRKYKHHSRTKHHSRRHKHSRRQYNTHEVEDVRDRFISPRVVSISTVTGRQPPVVRDIQPVSSPVYETPGSMETRKSFVPIDISPITNSIASNISLNTVAETDRSTSPEISENNTVTSITDPTANSLGENSVETRDDNSLHLSDLETPNTGSTDSLVSGKTSLETRT
jgi:hypothetical protein